MSLRDKRVLIRGGGELASGVAHRLHSAHFSVLMTEVPEPQAVRRQVSFCESVYDETKTVEGVTARLVQGLEEIQAAWSRGEIALMVDPEARIREVLHPEVEIDATIAKCNIGTHMIDAPLVIGLGVGFTARKDVHIVIETNRGHNLGRVITDGQAEPDTGKPGFIGGYSTERVMRAPANGTFHAVKHIGDLVVAGDIVASVGQEPMRTIIPGVIRGLLRNGTSVTKGMKSGDVDPRGNLDYVNTISEKGRAVAGGVLEAILTRFN